MMRIGSMNGAAVDGRGGAQAGRSGMQMQTDPVSKNIQNQIANAQQQLQEVSASQEMTPDQKMKKRQEIQQEINSLNQQLRQHQIDQRKEQQAQSKSKDSSVDDMLGGEQSTGKAASENQGSGLSQASMKAMMSADSSIKQAQIQGNVATRFEGRAGVLKAEIKQGGGNVEAKQAELEEVEQKAVSATASQMNTLADANQTIEEAAKAEQSSTNKTDTSDTKAENKADKNDKAEQDGKETGNVSKDTADGVDNETVTQPQETSAASDVSTEVSTEAAAGAAVQDNTNKHIDICL